MDPTDKRIIKSSCFKLYGLYVCSLINIREIRKCNHGRIHSWFMINKNVTTMYIYILIFLTTSSNKVLQIVLPFQISQFEMFKNTPGWFLDFSIDLVLQAVIIDWKSLLNIQVNTTWLTLITPTSSILLIIECRCQ